MPALLTRMSTCFFHFTTSATAFSTLALSATSMESPLTSTPVARDNSSPEERADSKLMSPNITAAPSEARRYAMARPMPRPPPVTSATLPDNLLVLIESPCVHLLCLLHPHMRDHLPSSTTHRELYARVDAQRQYCAA